MKRFVEVKSLFVAGALLVSSACLPSMAVAQNMITAPDCYSAKVKVCNEVGIGPLTVRVCREVEVEICTAG